MICYECGIKAQRKEIRLAKKEKREPRNNYQMRYLA